METKVCNSCQKELPLTTDNFHKSGKQPSGRQKWKAKCKGCECTATRESFVSRVLSIVGKFECVECGYNKCFEALDFHHLDPNEKDFNIAAGKSYSSERLRKELAKCTLLCSNCHREVHAGKRILQK